MTIAQDTPLRWWQHRSVLLVLALCALVPLIWPAIPPLVDLPGHMGRYRVELDYDHSAVLRSYYHFQWRLIGNLGVDLLIIPMAKIFGLEFGVKLIVMAIPAMTAAGLIWIAREVHGRVPPTTLFALPLGLGHPFLFGFVNFALSMALALLAFALWLRLARLGYLRLRAAVFVVIAPVIWVTHTFGWGMLGVLAFSAEVIRQHDRGIGWLRAFANAGVQCLSMTPPLIPLIAWRNTHAPQAGTADWFNWQYKWRWLGMTLRDRWMGFDKSCFALLTLVITGALFDPRMRFSRNLAASALALCAVYVLLPRIIFGSAYADMRLTPFLLAIAIVAIRPAPHAGRHYLGAIALVGLAFFGARIGANTVSLAIASARQSQALGALDHVPEGARLVSFGQRACGTMWSTNRMEHLAAMAIVRRHAFSNDQWYIPGAQLMTTIKADAPGYVIDPSQMVFQLPCRSERSPTIDGALARLPRAAFDYVWLIDPPRYDERLTRGMTPIWRAGTDVLYRIDVR